MTDPSVCVLVLNWNGVEDTLECVHSLKQITYSNAEFMVIDNGSTDDSVARLKTEFPDLDILELESNRFFGGGNNAGLEWAREKGFNYVIFLNNDTTVEPGFIEPLLQEFKRSSEVGMVAPLMCYSDTPDLIWYGGGKVNLWTGVVEHKHIRKNVSSVSSEPQKSDYITGCCLMMPTKLVSDLGGFDPAFKMYGEDVDLSLRTRSAGYDLVMIPESKIYHKVSASVGGEFSLRKMKRKAGGILKLFGKYARWYQWPTIVLGQAWYLLKQSKLVLNVLFGRTT